MGDNTEQPVKFDKKGLREAADALGIQWDHIESALAHPPTQKDEPKPVELPEIVLTRGELKLICDAIPKLRWNSKITDRTFIEFALMGIKYELHWRALPDRFHEKREALRQKFYRWAEHGYWDAVWQNLQGSHDEFRAEIWDLLRRLDQESKRRRASIERGREAMRRQLIKRGK